MKLLLIDSRINEKQIFIDSSTDDTRHIIFDYMNDTYDSILSCDILAQETYTDIALVQHTDMLTGIKILEQEPRCDSYDSAPYSSFDRLRSFLRTLKEKNGLQRFDFLGCAMYDAHIMPTIFTALEADLGIDLRASTNFTGNAPDGDWIMESDNIDIRDKYFTEAIQEWRGTLGMPYLRPFGQTYGISGDIVGINSQSIVVSSNDYVQEAYTYGNTLINITGAIPDNLKNIRIKQVITNKYSNLFAAIDISNFVWTWATNGIAFIPSSLVGIPVTTVIPGFDGFAVITDISKTMYTWGGNSGYGGVNGNNGGIPTNLQNVRVNKIVSGGYGYGILSEDKKVYFMGNANTYGTATTPIGLSGVLIKDIASTLNAYAVITESNNVFAWGEITQGGTSSNFTTALTPSGLENIQVTSIVSNALAFAVIDTNKRVWAWGNITHGGAGTSTTIAATPSGLMNIPISKVYGFTGGFSQSAFIAIEETTKQLYLWGHSVYGGLNNGNSTTPIGLLGVSVEEVFNNQSAIACIDSDGIVRTFGNASAGGGTGNIPTNLTNVTISNIVSGRASFSALSLSGDVYSWGSLYSTGGETYGGGGTSAIKINGLQDIKQIGATLEGYVALSNNSKLYVWNNMPQSVGKSTAIIPSGLYYNTFDSIYTHNYSFAAISKDTQTVYTGGDINFGALNALDKLALLLPGKRIIKNVTHGMVHTILTDEPIGNVYTYGSVEGDKTFITYSSIPSIPTNLQNRKIINIYTTDDTFAALDSSKNLWTWGINGAGTDHYRDYTFRATIMNAQIPAGISGIPIRDVYSINARFYAISDISKNLYSFNGNGGSISTGLAGIPIKKVVANPSSFAVITDISNRVYTVGDTNNGGAGINSTTAGIPSGLENIEIDQIATTQIAFAVIDTNKRLWCWGGYGGGGVNANTKLAVTPAGLENITFKSVVANERAFAAVSETGTVYAWGMNDRGGAGIDNFTAATPSGLENIPVTQVVNSLYAFAAITDISKNVYAWGQLNNGGVGVTTREARIPSGLQGIPIKGIVSNQYSFAAVTDISDRVYAWGHVGSGGVGVNNSSAAIPIGLENISISGLIANQYNYHAIQSDGTLYTWGMLNYQVWWQNYRTYQFFNKRSTVRHAVADTTLTGRGINLIEGSTPLLVPSSPRNASVVVGNTEATVSFTASQYTGNSPILHYEVNVNNGETILTSETVAPITISGLTNGITYTATVKAVNAIGSSAASSTLTFIPGTALPPTTVTSVSTDGQLTVSFSASPNNNGSTVTHYIVSVSGQDISGLTSPITFTGLTNGTSYNITVRAVNEVGIGAASVPITGMPGTVPGAPSILKITPNGTSATITVSPGTTGTTRTEYYLVESVPSGITISGASRNIVVSGLTAGTNYQFTAKAVSSIGESAASAQSNVITAFNLQVGNGRYVRFSRSSGYPDYININQIDIFDASNNKHTPVTATQSTTLGGYPASNVIDSDINSFSHTNVSSDSEWVEVDLGTDKEIKKVVIYHRSGVFSRALNLYFTVKDSINNITYTSSPIITSAASHTFDNITGTRNTNMGVPQITNMTYANDELTIAFNTVNDALTYTIAANTISKTATEGPITISGFTNGTTYNLIVSATGTNGINFTTTTFIAGNALIAPLIAPTISGVSIAKDTATISFNTLNLNPSVSKYVISSLSGDITYETTSSPAIISGLIAGTNYQFTVRAVNLIGESPASSPSDVVTATNEVLTRYVRFSRVTNVNYIMLSEIEVYDQHNVKIIPASASQSSTFPGYPASNVIDNNTSTFHHTQNSPNEFIEVDLGTPRVVSKVISYNRQGAESNSLQLVMTTRDTNNNVLYTAPAISTTAPSHTFNITSASEVVTPSAPTGLTALPGTGQITVNFTPPADVSGFPTASYRITVTPGNVNRIFINRPITISGLTNGTSHTVTVAAINANGTGAAATISGIRPSTVPNAPTLLSVSGGDGIARISFSTPLNDGGSTITNYMAISTPDNMVGYGLVSPITISGLTDGTPYTFRVAAINAAGTGAYSADSSSITLTTSIPTSATQAVVLSAPTTTTTSNTSYIDTFVQASTKTAAEIFVELRAAKKAAIATRTTEQISELTKTISKSIATKAASAVLNVSFDSIVPTLTSTYANIESKPVVAILPDFTTITPPVIDLSTLITEDKHILIEAPENSSFSLSDGTVTKSFTISTLSGEKYMYDTDDVSQKYFIGSVLTFGTFSKRILGFGSVIFGTATVTVTIPITFTLSGIDTQIFGQLFTMAGTQINVNNTLTVSGFYDQSGYSWVHYKQGDNEDDFTAGVKDVSGAVAVKNTILSALNVSGGSTYVPARQGTTNIDCSAVFQGHTSKLTNFHNLQDFIISYFANKILGHPGALAAISNDSEIRANVTNGFPITLNELQTMGEDKLKSIVQQMMNQDLARFRNDEKGVFTPLKFYAGDKVIMRLILSNNTYSLKSPAGNPSSVVGGVTVAQSASATTSKVNIGSTDDYLLVFTLA